MFARTSKSLPVAIKIPNRSCEKNVFGFSRKHLADAFLHDFSRAFPLSGPRPHTNHVMTEHELWRERGRIDGYLIHVGSSYSLFSTCTINKTSLEPVPVPVLVGTKQFIPLLSTGGIYRLIVERLPRCRYGSAPKDTVCLAVSF